MRSRMSDMNKHTVIRSVRVNADVDRRIEQLAADRGITVSALIRESLMETVGKDERRARLENALRAAASLPDKPGNDTDSQRDVMWGTRKQGSGSRVPR